MSDKSSFRIVFLRNHDSHKQETLRRQFINQLTGQLRSHEPRNQNLSHCVVHLSALLQGEQSARKPSQQQNGRLSSRNIIETKPEPEQNEVKNNKSEQKLYHFSKSKKMQLKQTIKSLFGEHWQEGLARANEPIKQVLERNIKSLSNSYRVTEGVDKKQLAPLRQNQLLFHEHFQTFLRDQQSLTAAKMQLMAEQLKQKLKDQQLIKLAQTKPEVPKLQIISQLKDKGLNAEYNSHRLISQKNTSKSLPQDNEYNMFKARVDKKNLYSLPHSNKVKRSLRTPSEYSDRHIMKNNFRCLPNFDWSKLESQYNFNLPVSNRNLMQ